MHGADCQASNACLLLNQMPKRRMEHFSDENIHGRTIHGMTIVLQQLAFLPYAGRIEQELTHST
jgi:hypothetical protein